MSTKKNKDKSSDKIKEALLKKALGYNVDEVVEEYNSNDDGLVLTKRKVTTKYVPPDVSAIKVLRELDGEKPLEAWTDEELTAELERLKSEL